MPTDVWTDIIYFFFYSQSTKSTFTSIAQSLLGLLQNQGLRRCDAIKRNRRVHRPEQHKLVLHKHMFALRYYWILFKRK